MNFRLAASQGRCSSGSRIIAIQSLPDTAMRYHMFSQPAIMSSTIHMAPAVDFVHGAWRERMSRTAVQCTGTVSVKVFPWLAAALLGANLETS